MSKNHECVFEIMPNGTEICFECDAPKNPAAVSLGRLGGRIKTAAKAEAARRNGKLGGRPRKTTKQLQLVSVSNSRSVFFTHELD
jgi:hypothetical protein